VRPLLQFLGFCFIVFFAVGELRGWYVGLASHTPMLLYKMNQDVSASRIINYSDKLDFDLTGKVRKGTVRLEVYFEVPSSFQTGKAGTRPRQILEQEFFEGQTINLKETFEEGRGKYTVRISFEDATGIFNLDLPNQNSL
jgi:hypothetical protein